MTEAAAGLALVAGLVFFDAFAGPRASSSPGLRSFAGTAVLLAAGTTLFGALLGLTGAWIVSAILVVMLAAALTLVSNIKRSVLGEPLVFSDFALVGAVFQHPQFYISALKRWQMALLAVGLVVLFALVAGFSTASLAARAAGLSLSAAGGAILAVLLRLDLWKALEFEPDPDRDVLRHGLVATTLAYWSRWRRQPDPDRCEHPAIAGRSNQLVVIIQCESFTDPADLFDDPSLALPGLEAARSMSLQSGRLNVSGFGAYTMRTEYGVLFGRGEDQLGMRRFDPFLTARGEASWALSNRLGHADWTSIFVHPHDLRFYGRHKLMPQAGFNRLVGEDAFAPPVSEEGRYVTDQAVCDKIFEIADNANGATMIYAVTIENHGPWPPDKPDKEEGQLRNGTAYLRLLRRSDAMLSRLLDRLPALGRPVTLCFFGDHRPSIPMVSEPGQASHTPYVIASFGPDGVPLKSSGEDEELTPAQLHHSILAAIDSWEGEGKQ
ncbi:MAG: LTA synthase family protein [Erythrobacter sp.]|jgi:phosphoglycerol transferase MdoB-like AlkP superfamily enzyme